MGLGRKLEKGFKKAEKAVNKVGRKAEGAIGSVQRIANKAENKVEGAINTADKKFGQAVNTANKVIQKTGEIGSKAIDVSKNVVGKIDKGLAIAEKYGLGGVPVVGDAIQAAHSVSSVAKRGIDAADKVNEKIKKTKLEKDSIRKKAIEAASGGGDVAKTFV